MEPLKGKKPCIFVLANLPAKLSEFRMCKIAVSYLMKIINLWNKDYPSICGMLCVIQKLSQHWTCFSSVP